MASPPSILWLLANEIAAASYVDMHPAISNFWILVGVILMTFIVGTATGNYSQTDRLWSITPIVFAANYVLVAGLRGYLFNARLTVMAVLAFVWGVRLTYNFGRKGGYKWSDEDYRWPALRKILKNPILWHLFSFFFISIYQNLLLFLITLPAKTAFDSVAFDVGNVTWQPIDYVATVLFVSYLVLETIADQQQWNFQTKKWDLINSSGLKVEELPEPYNLGFLTSGLFAYSRHPNFFAEFSIWWMYYLFAVAASGSWWNFESILGPFLLMLLFFGSAPYTEYLTSMKYPKYKEYQARVSMLFPWFPRKA
ncbi:hypothetical protein HDU83_005088 [Entophlyctis luteolus]|nr:hypothetical protein HDU83_005088 [Entophlyctis luteolus]